VAEKLLQEYSQLRRRDREANRCLNEPLAHHRSHNVSTWTHKIIDVKRLKTSIHSISNAKSVSKYTACRLLKAVSKQQDPERLALMRLCSRQNDPNTMPT
jgi:hypothetical protein